MFTHVDNQELDPERNQQSRPTANPEQVNISEDKEMSDGKATVDAAEVHFVNPPQTTQNRGINVDESMCESEVSKASEMSLDERKKLINSFDHTKYMTVGTYVDATDTTNSFLLAKIVQIDG